MNKCYNFLIVILALLMNSAAMSQTVDPSYEIGTWQGFRSAAVSFTFDDSTPNQFSKAIPLFNEFNFRLTLFTATRTSWIGPPNWTKLQEAASQGHEIASHTLSHTSFADLSDTDEENELRESRDDINAHINGQKCLTLAYPYCVTGDKTLCTQYYLAARICSGQIVSRNPSDFMAISSIVCGTEGSVKTADHFISRANSAVKSKGWCVYLLHGVDNDGGWSPVTSETLRETLDHFKDNPNEYWVDTFATVVLYIKERNAASITELAVDESSITLQVTDTLDDDTYDVPISIRRVLPAGWPAATVQQNGQPVASDIIELEGRHFIQFDAVPDGGDVILAKSSDTAVDQRGAFFTPSFFSLHNYPNPFNPTTTIEFELVEAGKVNLQIFDARGQSVQTLVNEELVQGRYTKTFYAGDAAAGVYFCRLKTTNRIQVHKMVLLP